MHILVSAFIPSPPAGQIDLGPFPLRAYALCIIAGVIVAVWLGERRWVARGGRPGEVSDIAVWAVPFGLVGGRLYHVVTTPELYFGAGGHPWQAFADLARRAGHLGRDRAGRPRAPGSPAGAEGSRCRPWPTRWPRASRWPRRSGAGATTSTRSCSVGPTDAAVGPADRLRPIVPPATSRSRRSTRRSSTSRSGASGWRCSSSGPTAGSASATAGPSHSTSPLTPSGRGWIEALRIDDAHHVLGLRLNDWTALLVFLGALTYIVVLRAAASRARADRPDGRAHAEPTAASAHDEVRP